MAIFTSEKGYFEVISLSFAPDIITLGEETAFRLSIKNVSGKKIGSMYLRGMLYYRCEDGSVRPCNDVFLYGGASFAPKSISWANGETKTFEGKISFSTPASYPPRMDTRLLPLFTLKDIFSSGGDARLGFRLLFAVDSIFADGTNTDNIYDLRGAGSEYLRIIDARYNPAVTFFSAERCTAGVPDDEGENILLGMALGKSAAAKPENMSLSLTYRNRAGQSADPAAVNLTHLVPGALVRETQAVVSEILDKNADWELVLFFGDAYESAAMTLTLSRAFANVHLSGASTGGVCFGSFSRATENNPLFQNCYPAEFYAGIRGGFTYDPGETDTGGSWIDGRKIYRYVFTGESALDGASGVIGSLPSKIGALVSAFGTMKSSDGSVRPIPFGSFSSLNGSAGFYVDGGGAINLQLGSGYSGRHTINIILEYTKEAGT